jgi:small GTP-binding protein
MNGGGVDMGSSDKFDGIKIVVVGDGAVGKTTMLVSYTTGRFPEEYTPTVFTNTVKNISVRGQSVKVGFWDTAGQEDYDRIRSLSYKKANMVMVCYSIDSRDSFTNVKLKWLPEAKQYAADALILVVGLKSDLRSEKPKKNKQKNEQHFEYSEYDQFDEKGNRYYLAEDGYYYYYPDQGSDQQGSRKSKAVPKEDLITYDEGKKLALEMKASGFKECSAKTGAGLNEIFDMVLVVADHFKMSYTSKCSIA